MEVTPTTDIDQEALLERASIQLLEQREVSMAMYCAMAQQPDQWVIDGLIEQGDQVIIAGAPKAGKSIMAVQMALAVASGGRFLRWKVSKPQKVVYVNLEIREKNFGRRLEKQIYGWQNINSYSNFYGVQDYRTIDVMDSRERRALADRIKNLEPALIVWDVLARMHSVDEKDPGMKLVMQAIRMVSNDRAHIIVHHTRKPAQDSETAQTAYDIRGSGAIHGECDLALILSRRPGQGARYSLSFSARNIDAPDEILLNNDANLNFFEAAEEEANKLKAALQTVYARRPVVLATELADHIKNIFLVGDRRAKDYIKEAVEAGWIQRVRRSDSRYEYHLTETAPMLRVVS